MGGRCFFGLWVYGGKGLLCCLFAFGVGIGVFDVVEGRFRVIMMG